MNMKLSSQGKPLLTFTGARQGGHLPRPDEVPAWIVEPQLPKPTKATRPMRAPEGGAPAVPELAVARITPPAAVRASAATPPRVEVPARAGLTTAAVGAAGRTRPTAAVSDDSVSVGGRYCVGDSRCAVVGGKKRCWKSRQCQKSQG